MLSKVSQIQKEKILYDIAYMWKIYKIETDSQT